MITPLQWWARGISGVSQGLYALTEEGHVMDSATFMVFEIHLKRLQDVLERQRALQTGDKAQTTPEVRC